MAETDYAYDGDGNRIGQTVKQSATTVSDTTYTLDTATSLTMVLAPAASGARRGELRVRVEWTIVIANSRI